jgi:aldose 1-epimerase
MTFGGVIVSLRVPDREGRLDDIVLGYDSIEGYIDESPYFGAIIGRYGNRIGRGRFTLDGVTHQLATNDGAHHLHGGPRGLDKVVWSAEPFSENGGSGVTFAYTSPHGDQGYPGTLSARVSYTLTGADELVLDYVATTDRATPVNLTQHSYWNLAGSDAPPVLAHELTIRADHYTPVDETLIPSGAIAPVAGTPFDFRNPATIESRIGADNEQLRHGQGYDHNFVLRSAASGALRHAARLAEPTSGRVLDLHTTEPGLQFYSGNFLDGSIRGKGDRVYRHRSGICLEAQHFPDSPNQPHFPSTILRPGSEYRSRSVFAFGVGPESP